MGMQHDGFVDPAKLGHWEGKTFIFDEPFVTRDSDGNPLTLRALDTTYMVLPEDISAQEVLEALVNPVSRDHA